MTQGGDVFVKMPFALGLTSECGELPHGGQLVDIRGSEVEPDCKRVRNHVVG